MLLGLGLIHSHFLSSVGPLGVYTTIEVDEEISFPDQLNTIEIKAPAGALEISFNNDPAVMYIPDLSSDGISGLPISRIVVKGSAGQKISWRGLICIAKT